MGAIEGHGRIRTCYMMIRNQLLYPIELRGHKPNPAGSSSVEDYHKAGDGSLPGWPNKTPGPP